MLTRTKTLLVGSAIAAAIFTGLPLQGQGGDRLKIIVGPERKVLPDGLQPFMFLSREGTLVVQAQLPTGTTEFPGRWGTVRSTDGGRIWKTWEAAKTQGGGPFIEGSAAQLKDGTILILQWAARGPKDGYFIGKLWESRDDWRTLAGPTDARFHLPQGKGGFDDGGNPVDELFLHRTLLEMPNGDLLATAYGWFQEDTTPSSYKKTMNKFRSLLLKSKDRGRNWALVSTIAVDPAVGEESYNEPVLVRLTQGKHEGRLIVLLRTGSNKAKWPNPLYQTESDDEGKTWSKPRPLAFDGVDPELIEMRSGILVAGFGWRTKESRQKIRGPRRLGPEHGNYVAFSLDQGATWTQVTRLTKEPTTGYVAIRELEPNKLFMVYDVGDGWFREWADYPKGIDRAICGRLLEVRKE
ncbi:MAG: exo-alpha-sialidase [Pirellulales bacterium]|nr:exo-alpha-sialidase [Pirellulales bacterium]